MGIRAKHAGGDPAKTGVKIMIEILLWAIVFSSVAIAILLWSIRYWVKKLCFFTAYIRSAYELQYNAWVNDRYPDETDPDMDQVTAKARSDRGIEPSEKSKAEKKRDGLLHEPNRVAGSCR